MEHTLSHLYTNTCHIYCVTKFCGATVLQSHILLVPQNLLLGSNIGYNDKKGMDNEYFMHLYTKTHKWIE